MKSHGTPYTYDEAAIKNRDRLWCLALCNTLDIKEIHVVLVKFRELLDEE